MHMLIPIKKQKISFKQVRNNKRKKRKRKKQKNSMQKKRACMGIPLKKIGFQK